MANGNGKGQRRSKPKAKPRRNGTNGNAMRPTRQSRAGVANNNGNSRPVQNRVTSLSGSDFLTTIEVRPDPTTAERVLKIFPISPSAYPGTRLTQMSQLWEFFRFSKFHVRYVPAVPTTLACQLVLYLDLDPSDDPLTITDADALIRQAVAQTGSQQWNFHAGRTIPLAMRADRQYYFTGLDKQNIRFSQQGAAYLIQVTNPINFNGETIAAPLEAGSLFIDWTVQFSTPQINPAAAISSSTPIGNRSVIDLTPDVLPYDFFVSGLRPGAFYILSGILDCSPESANSLSFWAYRGDTFQTVRQSYLGVELNDVTEARGFVIAQADGEGIINELRFSRTGDGLTGINRAAFVIATVFDEPVTTGSSVLRCVPCIPSSSEKPVVSWDLCAQCATPASTHNTSVCGGLPNKGITPPTIASVAKALASAGVADSKATDSTGGPGCKSPE